MLPPAQIDLETIAWQSYPERCERAVEVLAQGCGADGAAEVARFRWCRERLSKAPLPVEQGNILANLAQWVAHESPLLFELVLTYAGGGPRGFAYLTQGRPSGTLPANLAALLAGTLQLHLEAGGARDDAELLVDLFRLAFPHLGRLADYSPLAQGMIVGAAPDGAGIGLKVYFNTRLDAAGGHGERVRGMLERCGVQGGHLYEALYRPAEGVHFHGVGVDLDRAGAAANRAKLYLRLPRAALPGALTTLSSHLEGKHLPAARAFVDAMAGQALVDSVELAVALRQGAPTLKLTLFFATREVGAGDLDRVASYLSDHGYDPALVRDTAAALSHGAERAQLQPHPLHAVGVEMPMGDQPKINVYLQPVM